MALPTFFTSFVHSDFVRTGFESGSALSRSPSAELRKRIPCCVNS